MRTEVTDAEIHRYRDNGFLVMEDFLADGELETWRDRVEAAVVDRRDTMFPGLEVKADSEVSEAEHYYRRVFTQRVNLWQTNVAVKDLILEPRIGRMACELAGIDGVRIWHDQALIKAPFANPTSYHLDVPYWSFTSPDALSIWVALDDATVENGCLWYLPGSHLARKFNNVNIGKEIGAIFDVYPEWKEVSPVPAPVRAGGCVWHSGLVAHGAGANMTNGARRAMTAGFMPDGATFNGQRNILTEDQVAALAVGDLMDDDRQNPVVFSRLTESMSR